MPDRVEADAVREIAQALYASGAPALLGGKELGWGTFMVPGEGLVTHDETDRLPDPARPTGTIQVYDPESFMLALAQRQDGIRPSVAYADDGAKTLTAILNDDKGDAAGWRDYRVEMVQRRTPEWVAWLAFDGKYLPQEEFAEMLEERARQVVEPDAATMLEIAQTLQGTLKADWSAGHRLQSGARQLKWSETISASGGESGTLEPPASFVVRLPLFQGDGTNTTDVRIMFRFRIGPPFKLGYKIPDADFLEREAFDASVAMVREATGAPTIILGPAPHVS